MAGADESSRLEREGEAVTRCPACESFRVVIVLAPNPHAFCASCGARWLQEGSRQSRLMRRSSSSLPRSIGDDPDVTKRGNP